MSTKPQSGLNKPQGTVTLLFTDIEGSTRHLERLGAAYAQTLEDHHRLLRAAFQKHGGHEMGNEGDAFFVVFQRASDAVAAASEAQYALDQHPWTGEKIRVRMGIHTGEPTAVEDRYIGMDVHRAARIAHAAHGGQVLLSQATYELVQYGLPRGVRLRDLGAHRLRDMQGLQRLHQLVIDGLPDQFPPVRTLDAHPHNLPLQLTPLVGRADDMTRLRASLERPAVRLITLTGPGGVGKTRLALQVAAEAIDLFPDGVFFVPLAAIGQTDLVAQAIAQALNVAETERRLLDLLIDYLRGRHILLVLDNFEQLMEAASVVADLLRACADLKCIVTSRAPLQIQGEHELPIHPLAADASVELFMARAQAVRPDFRLTPAHTPQVHAICQRLDGLPLAIELAAARIRLRSPAEILAQLDRPLQFLTGGGRDRPDRQQTMRQAIEWSGRLLDPSAAALFRRLAVFVGGWTLESAEAICDMQFSSDVYQAGDHPNEYRQSETVNVLDDLDVLVNASLVRAHETDHTTRYTMLQTIHEYATERLSISGEAEPLRRRHAAHYLALAETAVSHYQGQDQGLWLDRMEAELDNLRAALTWCQSRGEVAWGLRLVGALDGLWMRRGLFSEGRQWLKLMLGLPDAASHPAPYAAALFTAGMLAYLQSDYPTAAKQLEASLAQHRSLNHQPGIVLALTNLALVARDQGDQARATALFEEALTLTQSLGDRRGTALASYNLSIIHLDQAEYDRAAPLLETSLASFRSLGDPRGVSMVLVSLGIARYHQGDLTAAHDRLTESLTIATDIKERWVTAIALKNLALVALKQGDFAMAQAHLSASLTTFHELEDRSGLAECLQASAALAYAQSQPDRAAWLLGASHALLASIGAVMVPADRAIFDSQVIQVQAALTADTFTAAWADGQAASLATMRHYALNTT